MTVELLLIATGVAWVEHDGTVYAAHLPDGPPLVLAGPGAAIWLSLARGGTLDDVTRRVADEVGSPAESVAADIATFVDGLVDAGLVTRGAVPVAPTPSPE